MAQTTTARDTARDLDPFASTAYASIRDRIVRLDLPPGSLISENSLGAELGLSRTPVREALKRLEREYLVSIMPRRGIVVTDVDLRQQLQLLDMRRGIEVRIIARGIERATPDQRAEFKRLAEGMQKCAELNDLQGYVDIDAVFDAIIEESCANRFLTDAMRPVHALIRRYWQTQKGSDTLRAALLQHVKVAHAAALGNAEEARSALLDLCEMSEQHLLKQMR
ncbi:GntR family transcriptional regulator [Salipiger sp.]|uniref:GntR family transcriptional regulator n=1 Tax=Salipiger sp. TaxID=2078585 RepID=UPI003A97C5E5